MNKSSVINSTIIVVVTLICYLIFNLFKNIQAKNIDNIINEIKKIPKENITLKVKNLNEHQVELIPQNLLLNNKNNSLKKIGQDYLNQFALMETLILKLDFEKCQKENFSFLVKYDTKGSEKSLNFSKIINLEKINYKDIVFFPVYHTTKLDNNKKKFEGYFYSLIMDQNYFLCIKNIFKVKNQKNLSLPSFAYYGDKDNFLKISSINKKEFGNISIKKSAIPSINYNKSYTFIEKNLKILNHAKRSIDCKKNNCSYPNECYINSVSLKSSNEHQQICSVNTDTFKTDSYFLKENEIININGKIINGLFKINIIGDNNFYYGELINTTGNFTFAYKLPRDGNYRIILSNKNNLYHYIENNIEIENIKILYLQ